MAGANTPATGACSPSSSCVVAVQLPIALSRDPQKVSGECDNCINDLWSQNTLFLTIELTGGIITLCPKCEGELLQALLANYVKRMKKKQGAGFRGPLRKLVDDDEEGESE